MDYNYPKVEYVITFIHFNNIVQKGFIIALKLNRKNGNGIAIKNNKL